MFEPRVEKADEDIPKKPPIYIGRDCPECDICSKACPALDIDLLSIRQIAKEQGIEVDPIYGAHINFALGYHTDTKKRLNSASGGVATAILEYMLDTKQVDCVIVIICIVVRTTRTYKLKVIARIS